MPQATIQNQQRNAILGLLADAMQPVKELGNKVQLPVVGGVGDFFLEGAQGLLDDASYSGTRALGRGGSLQTFQPDARILDLAGLALPAAKGAKLYGKELARQIESGSGLVGKNVMNPRMNIIAYRGISKPYDENYKQAIEWFSESPELANVYSGLGEGSNIIKKDLGDIDKNVVDLGFRNSSVEVPFNEIKLRLINSIVKKIDNKNLTKNDAKEIVKNIQSYNSNNNLKKVHQWWQEDEIIANSLKKAGYDAIKDEERGFKTYGLLK